MIRLMQQFQRRLEQKGMIVDILQAEDDPATEIVKTSEQHRADLVVVGARGLTGLERVLLGSVSRRVARHSGAETDRGR